MAFIPYLRHAGRVPLIAGIERHFVGIFKDKVRDEQIDEIMYAAIKHYRPRFLNMTRIMESVDAPSAELQRLAELEQENANLLALLQVAQSGKSADSEDELQDKIRAAIVRGLGKDNAQMVGQALNYIQDLEGKEFLSDLQIEIVPYTIKDTSLEEIILRAPEEIVVKCEAALRKRRAVGQSNPAELLTWEREWEKERMTV